MLAIPLTAAAVDSCAMNLRDRLRAAVERSGLRPSEVERRAGLTAGYLSRPLNAGVRRMDEDKVAAIARVLGVSAAWLGAGEGDMDARPREASTPARDPGPVRSVPDEAPPLQIAVLLAYRQGEYTPEDALTVLRLVQSGQGLIEGDGEDLVRVMLGWLTAAKRLRLAGKAVTIPAIAWELASVAAEANACRDEALNREALEEARGLGIEPPTEPALPPSRKH